MRPGITVLPDAFTTVAPRGTCTLARGPAPVMRSPLTRMTESVTAGPPVPSTNRAPTIAVTGPALPRCALGAAAKASSSAVHKARSLGVIRPVLLRFTEGVSRRLGSGRWPALALQTGVGGSKTRTRPAFALPSWEPGDPAL